MYRVLIVEDDSALRQGLCNLLQASLYRCYDFSCAESAVTWLSTNQPDICIIDRQLPKMSGDKLCQTIKAQHPALSVLILSGKNSDSDKIRGLQCGADDYVTKPFNPEELLARLAAIRRRIPYLIPTPPSNQLKLGDTIIDLNTHTVTFIDGSTQTLTLKEARIIERLQRSTNRVVTRDELYDFVWGLHYLPNSRALDQYMVGLRHKLRDTSHEHRYLVTVRGLGYSLNC